MVKAIDSTNELLMEDNTFVSCKTCKYEEYDIDADPCILCTYDLDKWEPKEEKNE